MMETITFKYEFYDENGERKVVKTEKFHDDGLMADEICEMFEDFMKSAGFAEDLITKYFKE